MTVKRKITWIVLLLLTAGIKLFSFYPAAVESWYATGIYPFIGRLQRALFGWLPFSIGDILYLFVGIWLVVKLVSLVRRLIRRQADGRWVLSVLRRCVFVLLLVYVLFNGLWGLNYDRRGIADQLQLKVEPYSNGDLATLLQSVCGHLNELDSVAGQDRSALGRHSALFAGAVGAYDSLAAKDPRFRYNPSSIKSSLFGYLNDYLGFGGYYNPFTGEAQVNTTLPLFSQPFTTCHEMGHQLGYARENEANFSGYLAARTSADPAFRYSVYFDMYLYAARELYSRDSTLVTPLRDHLRPGIRHDLRELRRFNSQFENPFEPLVRRLYGSYLKANRQPQGLMTYNEVTAWIIAYAKKNGWDTI